MTSPLPAAPLTPPRHPPPLLGIACGAGAGALWGLLFLAPELARDFSPLMLTIGRYLCYGLIAAALMAGRWAAITHGWTARHWLRLGGLALTGNTLYYLLLASAVQHGGVAMTSLVIGFLPVAVSLIGSRDHCAVPLRALLPSLLACAAGAVCIGWGAWAAPPPDDTGSPLLGLLCAVGALASWTAYAVGNARALRDQHHVSAQDWNLSIGLMTGLQSVVLVPAALLLESDGHAVDAWLRFGAVSVGVAVLASVVGNALWNHMSRLLPLTLVGQMILFETLFALLYGLAWEQRLPVATEMLALICVVASVALCLHAHHRTGGTPHP